MLERLLSARDHLAQMQSRPRNSRAFVGKHEASARRVIGTNQHSLTNLTARIHVASCLWTPDSAAAAAAAVAAAAAAAAAASSASSSASLFGVLPRAHELGALLPLRQASSASFCFCFSWRLLW